MDKEKQIEYTDENTKNTIKDREITDQIPGEEKSGTMAADKEKSGTMAADKEKSGTMAAGKEKADTKAVNKKEKPDTKDADKEEKTSVKRELIEWVKMLATAAIVVLLIQNFLIVNATIPSGSMENTIGIGDRVIASRLSYRFGEPERGDIIIFKYPIDLALGQKTLYIKRVIGLPGDEIEIHNATVYVNGEALEEDYLKEEWVISNDGYTFEVPEDHYLCLGDNRNNSLDGRFWDEEALKYGITYDYDEAESFRYVPKENILGKAVFRYWPLNSISLVK